jgi:tetratricopeptide (TPR) repeat protein
MVRLRAPLLAPFALALALAALAGPPAHAAVDWPVPRGPSHEPVPYRYDSKRLAAVPKAFLDDASACVLYAGSTYLVEADGTIETITHEITRLNGRKGVDKLGEYRSISYNPGYQKLTLNDARIHKADGSTVLIQPRNVHLRDVPTDFQSYDTDKQLIISFPSLGVGDTIEVKWTVRGKNPEHAGQFFTRYTFGDPTYPVVLDELRVRVPKTKPLHNASLGGKIVPHVRELPGARLYHWAARHTQRLPQDDNLPSKEELRPFVSCSTFPNWEAVGAWKRKLRASCWECTADIRKVVQEVTAGLTDPRDKARALTYWVRRNVRYVSLGEKHDYTPHLPAAVLANRFGDCKDTSQLLAVMLREAGIQVELATLGVLDDGEVLADVPSPWGTHAILLVTIAGKQHWIDTTARLAGWDFLPHDDRDRLCYVTDVKGKLRLVRTPPLAPEGNRVEQTTEVWVGPDGSTRCLRTVVSAGSAALGQRDNFVEVPPGERRRQITSELQDANSRTRLLRLQVDEKALEDYDQPVRARMEFVVPRHFTGSSELEGSITDSKVWGKLLAHNLDHDRKAPLVLYSPFELSHRYVIHVHPAYRLEDLPLDRTLRSDWGTFRVRAKALNDGDAVRDFEVVFHTRLDKRRVEPADFEAFRRFHEDVTRRYRVWLTLKPTTDLPSAPLLEALLAFAPQDSTAAATLARLYLSNGKAGDARRVLARARHYRPEDSQLWELSVKAAGRPAAEEEAQRELVRRFPGEVRYALALGATLVGAGKQEEARKVLEAVTVKGTARQRAEAHYHLARSYYRRDEMKPALEELDKASAENAESVNTGSAHLLRGRILEELGKSPEAAKAYKQALALDRESEEVLLALIHLTMKANQRMEALDYLRRYTLVVGSDVNGLLLAANAYLKLERYDDAFELASRARELRFDAKAQRILGLVYRRRGDHARAVAHLARADPDAVVLGALLRSYVPLANLRDLEACLDKAERLDGPPPALSRACADGRRLLQRRAELGRLVTARAGKERELAHALDALACAEALRAAGQPAASVEALLGRAFVPGVAVGPAYALRGRLALERGKLGLALADAEQAIRLCPRDAGGYYVRGRVRAERLALGALDDLGKAAELCGRKDADVLHALADALCRAGRLREALEAQRAAVKLKPADKEMADQLATLEKAARSKGKT